MPFIVPAPPPGASIPTNGRILLQSYNGIAWLVEQLFHRRARAQLVTRGDVVPLRVNDFCDDNEGGYGAGVLVLAPRRELRPGRRHSLRIVWRGDRGRESVELGHYRTSMRPDLRVPRWLTRPRVGQGPDGPAVFLGMPSEPGVVRVVAKLRPVGSDRARSKRLVFVFDPARICPGGPTADYLVAVANSHCPERADAHLCHTAHMFRTEADVGRHFRVTFFVADQAGNRRFAPGAVRWRWGDEMALTVCLRR